MSERTGSFPLMAIAAAYGVDYGDVLLMAGHERLIRIEPFETRSRDRSRLAFGAYKRLCASTYSEKTIAAIVAHADARWGDVQ